MRSSSIINRYLRFGLTGLDLFSMVFDGQLALATACLDDHGRAIDVLDDRVAHWVTGAA